MNPLEQHMRHCAHYIRRPGLPDREACHAGVIYDDLAKVDELGRTGAGLRLPCIMRNHDEGSRKGQPLCECPHFRLRTKEEAEAKEADIQAMLQKMEATLPLMGTLKKEHKGKDWAGTKECPVCKGTLHLNHCGFNGHTRGKCETEGCVAWIE